MANLIVQQEWFRWAWLLMLGFPLLMILLGEGIVRLRRRGRRLVVPLQILRNWVLPVLALYLILSKVLEVGRATLAVRLVETLLWILVIYAVLTLVNILLFEEAATGSWQANVPKLFLDLSRLFLVLVGLAIVFSSVWGADLGGLLTALGVGSLVIGLALQDSLGNVFSGIALLFERPIAEGDWIQVGDETGKVIEISWRSVQLQTLSRDLLVVPNSELAKGNFKNLSRPSRLHQTTFEIGFSYDDPPNQVKQILKQVALETEGVLPDPSPWVAVTSYDDFFIGYKVGFCSASYETAAGVRNEFATRLWYAARRHRLTIPYPTQVEYAQETAPTVDKSQQLTTLLRSVPSLSAVAPVLVEQLQGKLATHDYGRGEEVLAEGERLPGLYFVMAGRAQALVCDRKGQPRQIAELAPGDFFGEKASLLGEQVSDVSVVALEDLEVLILDNDTLQQVLIRIPRLAHELGEVMELRRKLIQDAKNPLQVVGEPKGFETVA